MNHLPVSNRDNLFLMKALFTLFFCSFTLFLCAQQKELGKKDAFISGRILDEKKNLISAHLDVIDFQTKEFVDQSESKSKGNFRIPVAKKNNYIVYISKPGYLFQSVLVPIPDSAGCEKKLADIILKEVNVGKSTVLNCLSFDYNQALEIDESRPDLERVIALLNDMSSLQIEISGFTDKFGSVELLRQLSEQRAKAAADIFISSGFDTVRIKYKGYGPSNAIASNLTEEGRQLNNRIELKVLNMNLVPQKGSESKQKKGVLNAEVKPEVKPPPVVTKEDENEEELDTIKVAPKPTEEVVATRPKDTLARIDYKGMFIADKAPLANSTVNLLGEKGEIFKTTKTDQNGSFQFLNVDADREVTIGLDKKETKKFKKIFLADTMGTVVKELSKVNGEFTLALLASDKTKLGTVYIPDVPLKAMKIKPKKAFIIGRVIDENGYPLKVQIEIIDNFTSQSVEKGQSNGEGRYNIPLSPGNNYDVVFNKSGYLFHSVSIEMPDTVGYEKTIEDVTLQKVEAGKKIVLNNIFFDSNQSTLRKESFSELQRAAKLMNDMTSLEIEIAGHTDNVGSAKSNRQLSEQRAKAVTDYLVSKGGDKARIKYKGYGADQPVATNSTESGRQMNRRTEFKVLKVDLMAEQLTKVKKMKETSEATDKKIENSGSSSDKSKVEKKKGNISAIPERLKKYDIDKDGTISYDEIMNAIDTYFEDNPKVSEGKNGNEAITALFDFYFEQ